MYHTTELYQTAAIKQLEQLAFVHANLTPENLMERAGEAVFHYLRQHWSSDNKIAVVCGGGNNGGDGYVVARLAKQAGYSVTVYTMASKDQLKGAALLAAENCERAHVTIQPFPDVLEDVDIIVDALLGTGVRGEIKGHYGRAIAAINTANASVVAIDVPSGLDADTGALMGDAVRAKATMTFIGLKAGLFTGHGPALTGEIRCDDLKVPSEIFSHVKPRAKLITNADVQRALPPRKKDSHKGSFGHVLIIGGDYGMAGAVRMAGEAAARVGAGLTTVATHAEHIAIVSGMRPELMCHAIHSPADLEPLLQKATVIAIGPGLGQSAWSKKLLRAVIETNLPKVLDADALNLLVELSIKRDDWILTPHPGEAARLLNTSASEIQKDRYTAIAALQQRYGGIIVLKGAGTIVQGLNPVAGVCAAGNPGMASGGMGDILTGVIAGLLAQKLDFETAARIGVYLHACAADRAALEGGERGLLATDLLPYLRRLVNP